MRPFKDEFSVPLHKVHRNWLRRLNLIILLPLTFILMMIVGIFESVFNAIKQFGINFYRYFIIEFIVECWNGTDN